MYIAELAANKNPWACAARNIHGFTTEQVDVMAQQWEPIPSHYLALDVTSLFRQDTLEKDDIVEVEMDADDLERDIEDQGGLEASNTAEEETVEDDGEKHVQGEVVATDHKSREVNEPAAARQTNSFAWSSSMKPKKSILKTAEIDDEEEEDDDEENGESNPLAGLLQAYSKREPKKETVSSQKKHVTWADTENNREVFHGFKIGGSSDKKQRLIIGPGSGYVVRSNPHQDEVGGLSFGDGGKLEQKRAFSAQLRAEQEEFKSIGSRRREEDGAPGEL